MRVYRSLKSRLSVYKRELWGVLLIAVTFFLLLSFCSLSVHDASWFYYNNAQSIVTNWCGTMGAHVAALFWYLLGMAMWLIPLLLACVIGFLYTHDSVLLYIERIIAGVLIIGCAAVMCTMHGMYWVQNRFLGGAIGLLLYTTLHRWVGAAGIHIILGMVASSAIIIMFRISLRALVQNVYMVCVRMIQNIAMCSVAGIRRSWAMLNLTIRNCIRAIRAILNGSFWQESNVLIPSDQLYTEQHMSSQIDASTSHQRIIQETATQAQGHTRADEITVQGKSAPQEQENIERLLYELPSLSLFIAHEKDRTSAAVKQELEMRAYALEEKLRHFGISGSVVEIKRGPVVTVFEYLPTIDTKLSKILSLEDDLAMALQAMSIRILAPIPGTAVVGFEVANKKRQDVLFAEVIKSPDFINGTSALPLVLGKDTIGSDVVVDLARMPHLLIAGSTGSGKSIALNTMLISLLCRRTPDEVRLILIDPKRLEFASYADIAHLLFPIVTDPKGAAPVLRWVVHEMERRYEQMALCGVRSITDYNRCTRHVQHTDPFSYIVVIIDELADLMMTAGKEVEDLITRIAQMARAAGIHMIVATQRPSVDVITGIIKVNFPSRISFRVTSKIDSRTILDCGGADKLLGLGDMLFLDATSSLLRRVHGAYITSAEIEAVVAHIRNERAVEYLNITQDFTDEHEALHPADDQLYAQVIDFLQDADEVSISLLQRKFKIGYNRSARIIELLELKGMILPADGSKTRKVVR